MRRRCLCGSVGWDADKLASGPERDGHRDGMRPSMTAAVTGNPVHGRTELLDEIGPGVSWRVAGAW
jgi:hypothetical protein